MKIGILGGSFNPPHKGHIHISLEAKKRLDFNQIWWVPAKQNPFKTQNVITLPLREGKILHGKILGGVKNVSNIKIDACFEITKNYPQILVKDLDSRIKSIYTIDLLKRIVKKYPKQQFYWIIGADNILQFHKWKNWQQIIKLTPLIVCDREDFFYQATKSKAFLYAKKLNRIEFLRIKKSPESSSKIRNTLTYD